VRLIESYTAECCGKSRPFDTKRGALDYLVRHIQRKHPALNKRLEKEARECARSQNGCGYYDGSDRDTGWPNAHGDFRAAWRAHALEYMLREGQVD